MKNRMNLFLSSKKNSKIFGIFVSCVLVIICYLLVLVFGNFIYLSNDDTSIQSLLSGVVTGYPYPSHQFINYLLGFFISSLYNAIPFIQWWFVYSHLLLIFGMIMINYSSIKVAMRRNFNKRLFISLLLVVDILFFLYSINKVSFTIVPSIFGTGLLCIILGSEKISIKIIIVIYLLYFLCLFHRAYTGKIVFIFLCFTIIYKCFELRDKKIIVTGILLTLITFGLSNLSIEANRKFLLNQNGKDFLEFNNARAMYMDYPHDYYFDNEKIYNNVEWNYIDYKLVGNWLFMDEKVTPESLMYLHDNSINSVFDSRISNTLLNMLNNNLLIVSLAFTTFITIYMSVKVLTKNKSIFSGMYAISNVIISIAMLAYLIYFGRVPYRSVIIILIPEFFSIFITYIINYGMNDNSIAHIMLLVSLVVVLVLYLPEFSSNNRRFYNKIIKTNDSLVEYALENYNNVYIKTPFATTNISPRKVYVEKKPTNLISWGGSTYSSNEWNERLRINNISKYDYNVFLQDNVLFVCSFDVRSAENIMNHDNDLYYLFAYILLNKETDCSIKYIDTIDDSAFIYKFEKGFNKDNYIYHNGWLNLNRSVDSIAEYVGE